MLNHRQKFILEKLSQRDVLNVSSLAEELSVSKMTIHRDLDALQRAGLILKQHGKVFGTAKLRGDDPSLCQMCNRKIKEQNTFTLITREGRKAYLCCPHCGFLAYSHYGDIWQSLTTDFLHGYVISASQAYYLIEPELMICCSPSVLAFSSGEEAKRFQKGFGGRIGDMQSVIDFLTQNNVSL